MAAALPHVVVYARGGCSPCLATERLLRDLSARYRFVLSIVDVDLDPSPPVGVSDRVPVVTINGAEVMAERFVPEVLESAVAEAIESAGQTKK